MRIRMVTMSGSHSVCNRTREALEKTVLVEIKAAHPLVVKAVRRRAKECGFPSVSAYIAEMIMGDLVSELPPSV